MNILGMDLFLWFLLIEACLITPIFAVRKMASVRRDLAAGDPSARLRMYGQTMLVEWTLTPVLLTVWLLMGRAWADIGLLPEAGGWQWLAIVAGLAMAAAVAWFSWRASRDPEQLESIREQVGRLDVVVPHSPPEMRRFNWVSLTAGICEEIRYRGLLLAALTAVVGMWPAVLLSSVAFGIGHSYQGPGGVLKTGAIGLVMALVTVFSGSLFVPIILHAVIDLAQGRLLYRVMLFAERPPALDAAAG